MQIASNLEGVTNTAPPKIDVLVVGGGPAGSAAAISLARAGRSVTVVDKATFPRDKCCGDGLTTLALRELEHLGVPTGDITSLTEIGGARLRSPAGREFTVPLPTTGTYAAVARRLDLDATLLASAEREGAQVLQGVGVSGASRAGDVVTVDLDGLGPVTPSFVVAADGMWSTVRRELGLTPEGYRGEWHAFRQYGQGATGPARNELIVWFERDLLPGYAWSFPLGNGDVNIGFGMPRGEILSGKNMATIWRDLLERPHIREALGDDCTLIDRHTAWPIPARVGELPLISGSVMFTGDAAAATDVMTGEGIGQALLTGRLAAESILNGGSTNAVTERYERSVRQELVADHRMSVRLGKILASQRGAETALTIVAKSGRWGRRNFARWMFEDEPRAIAVTPRRWHRSMFKRPGAYA